MLSMVPPVEVNMTLSMSFYLPLFQLFRPTVILKVFLLRFKTGCIYSVPYPADLSRALMYNLVPIKSGLCGC